MVVWRRPWPLLPPRDVLSAFGAVTRGKRRAALSRRISPAPRGPRCSLASKALGCLYTTLLYPERLASRCAMLAGVDLSGGAAGGALPAAVTSPAVALRELLSVEDGDWLLADTPAGRAGVEGPHGWGIALPVSRRTPEEVTIPMLLARYRESFHIKGRIPFDIPINHEHARGAPCGFRWVLRRPGSFDPGSEDRDVAWF